jgi:hypothetical protein
LAYCRLLCFLQGRLPHELKLRMKAFEQLREASAFNQGLILPLAQHVAGLAPQVAASVADAVEHLDLDPATAVQQQQLAQGCIRKLFCSFCSKKTIASITVVRTSSAASVMQQHCQLVTCLHACLRQLLGCLAGHHAVLCSPLPCLPALLLLCFCCCLQEMFTNSPAHGPPNTTWDYLWQVRLACCNTALHDHCSAVMHALPTARVLGCAFVCSCVS